MGVPSRWFLKASYRLRIARPAVARVSPLFLHLDCEDLCSPIYGVLCFRAPMLTCQDNATIAQRPCGTTKRVDVGPR